MKTENLYKPAKVLDPKLSIKSSMPLLREAFGWLILIFIACDQEISREPLVCTKLDDTGDKDSLSLKPVVLEQIEKYLKSKNVSQEDIERLLSKSGDCPLASVQIESLVVAFSLFFPVVYVEFVNKERSMAAERKGGKRYEKRFNYSSEIRTLASLLDNFSSRGSELLLSWCFGHPSSDKSQEKQMQLELLKLCSNSTFRLQRTKQTEDDEYLNIIGLYSVLCEREGHSFSLESEIESKGSLRILKRAIETGLLPWITINNHNVTIQDMNCFQEMSRVVNELKVRVDLQHVEQPTKAISQNSNSSSSDEPRIGRNIILYGIPGSGKSHAIDTEYISAEDTVTRVVFHPDYLYANFVGQILPTVEDEDLTYKYMPGPFTRALQKAIQYPDQHHFLIIEEINRGNAAAIFGDIFQLLDRCNNGTSRYSITNRDIASYCYGNEEHPVSLPGNLTLLATMNTSDQNVFTIDTAFQRRWEMKMVINNIHHVPFANVNIADTDVTWKNFVEVVNSLIIKGDLSVGSNEDKRLGNFFVHPDELRDAAAFAQKVLKYLWDDAFKFDRQRFFRNSESSSLENVITAFCGNYEGNMRWENILNDSVCAELIPLSSQPSTEGYSSNDI